LALLRTVVVVRTQALVSAKKFAVPLTPIVSVFWECGPQGLWRLLNKK